MDNVAVWNENSSVGRLPSPHERPSGWHGFVVCSAHQAHIVEIGLRRLGFEIRDSMRWYYSEDGRVCQMVIVVGRLPLEGTVTENVLRYGTGALNVDAGRVGGDEITINTWDDGSKPFGGGAGHPYSSKTVKGRWPANVLHDGSQVVLEAFPAAKGQQGALTGNEPSGRRQKVNCYGEMGRRRQVSPRADKETSAARFFFNTSTLGEGLAGLIAYLQLLVTPPENQ